MGHYNTFLNLNLSNINNKSPYRFGRSKNEYESLYTCIQIILLGIVYINYLVENDFTRDIGCHWSYKFKFLTQIIHIFTWTV